MLQNDKTMSRKDNKSFNNVKECQKITQGMLKEDREIITNNNKKLHGM